MIATKQKTAAFVPVRLSSSRLPEKHLKFIGGKTLLSWVILRLKAAQELDEIVICTTSEKQNEQLKEITGSEDVSLFIYDGNPDDVVGRLTVAAVKHSAEICVLASGDCPLLSSETIDQMVRTLKENSEADNVLFSDINGRFPIHEGIIVSRRTLWELADKYSDTAALREHQFPVFLRNVYPDKFSHIKNVYVKDADIFYSVNHRISIDTPDDLKFINRLYDILQTTGVEFNLKNAIAVLIKNPEITDLNKHVYRKTLEDITHRVVFFVSEKPLNGYGHVRRAVETAGILVNRYGVGVRFLTFDEPSKKIIEESGLRADVGAADKLIPFHKEFPFDVVVFVDGNDTITQELIDSIKASVNAKAIVLSEPGVADNSAEEIFQVLGN
ncbi:MAG: NTP transferase domain-containing protein [Nitrospirae bacterium]|nr:NTP transferase domain-containing protein [Nitrospirota bacterium]MBF0533381.1 NTP transferase domain-containing protein [Nitrospirota bacterium]MBF0616093.1 NTP transferase domain-containing protein [Nitrospirota bacterium]